MRIRSDTFTGSPLVVVEDIGQQFTQRLQTTVQYNMQ